MSNVDTRMTYLRGKHSKHISGRKSGRPHMRKSPSTPPGHDLPFNNSALGKVSFIINTRNLFEVFKNSGAPATSLEYYGN